MERYFEFWIYKTPNKVKDLRDGRKEEGGFASEPERMTNCHERLNVQSSKVSPIDSFHKFENVKELSVR
jgi:hypothetical protein